jgi:bifunctional enzyme CysN/CysC
MTKVQEMGGLPFRMPVQSPMGGTARPGEFSGVVASGRIRAGDRVRIQPLGKETRVAGIRGVDGEIGEASAGEAITLTLQDALSLPDGALVSTAEAPASVADQFEATITWSGPEPLFPGRRYPARFGLQNVGLAVTGIKYRLDPESGDRLAADELAAGAEGVCNISVDRPVAFDPFPENPATGNFTVLDQQTGEPLGTGRLQFALRRAQNIHIQHVDIDKSARAVQKTQNPCVVWFTGLSGSGKSTIANRVEQRLYAMGHHTYLLDGDNVRHGLNRDLGFTEADRVENIRRVGEVAKLMVDAGLIVLTAFISPFRAERRMARDLLTDGEFLEVYVDVPLEIAEQRDPKGLYRKARRGELKNFTGIDSPYEPPEAPELSVNTARLSPEDAADAVIRALQSRGRILPRPAGESVGVRGPAYEVTQQSAG